MSEKKFQLIQHEGCEGSAYLRLLDFPAAIPPGEITAPNSILIHELIENYDGPSLILDLNAAGRAIGIEILYPEKDDD